MQAVLTITMGIEGPKRFEPIEGKTIRVEQSPNSPDLFYIKIKTTGVTIGTITGNPGDIKDMRSAPSVDQRKYYAQFEEALSLFS